jgi:S-adenosylmethionine:tRNA ribosyltransferase-isomerase
VTPARWPRSEPLDERLLVIEPDTGTFQDARVRDLVRFLRPGDALVVNDAATLPASLRATTEAGVEVEVRLLGDRGAAEWSAVLFGEGDWRTRTEDRSPPPRLSPGSRLRFGDDLAATVTLVHEVSPRLVDLRFDARDEALWSALYAHGKPVQYSHVRGPLALWHVQTAYGARPWAAEMASAGRPLTWDLLLEAKRRGVEVVAITHAAGLSATGEPALDHALPLAEHFDVPEPTVETIQTTRARGGRVIAVGTTVVRALEGSAEAHDGRLVPGEGTTDLRIDAGRRLAVVDGLLTGLHDTSATHFRLVQAFAGRELVERAYAHAESAGYQNHEFGDASLILPAA